MEKITTPTVFISYCWSSPEHAQWVLELAQDLVNSGIDVKLDRWDLKEGQDKYHFMEQMVNSEEINKVLVILDRGYKEKADSKSGGVGTETQIISSEIYDNVSQKKFIPIIAEKDDNGNPYQPAFIKNRIYIDLADNELMTTNFETLVRAICDKPEDKKPTLGQLPHYILDDNSKSYTCQTIIRAFKSDLKSKPHRINSSAREFLEAFINDTKKISNQLQ